MIPGNEKRIEIAKWAALFCVALIGVVIRILDGVRTPIFMDEMPILYNAAHLIKEHTLVPIHFSYPTFFSYIMILPVGFTFIILYCISGYPLSGLTNSQWVTFLFNVFQDRLMLSGRLLSVIAFAGILWIIYRLGMKKFGFVSLLFAFIFLAVDPLGGRFVAYSRYALPDVTAAFWVTLGLLFCIKYIDNPRIPVLRAAAFVIGLGISTKYNAAMAVVPLIVTFLSVRPRKWYLVLIQLAMFCILGVIAGSPGLLWAPQKYYEGYLWESRHMAEGHLGTNGIIYWWVIQYIWQCGTWMLPIIVLAVIISFVRRQKQDWIFLSLIISSFLVIGRFEKKSIHYFLFLYPALALYIGSAMSFFLLRLHHRWSRMIFILLAAYLFAIYPGYRIARMVKRDLMVDNRISAEKWIEKNIPSEKQLLLDPLMFTHLISKIDREQSIESFRNFGNPFLKNIESYFQSRPVFELMNIRDFWESLDTLDMHSADYLILSSANYQRFFVDDRSRWPEKDTDLYTLFIQRRQFYQFIFNNPSQFLPIQTFDGPAGPTIRIYAANNE